MALSTQSFADELRIEGITFKGFGIIPKAVTLHKDLTIEAKAIYAYFASFSGGGSCAFPSRDRILSDLKISKDRYYKHFKKLIENGLITVREEKNGTRFSRNIYTIKSLPLPQAEGSVSMSGINAQGYGIIPKAVTLDPRLPIEAKGLYAYYAAFTGSGTECTPKRDDVLFHLSISSERYSKYRDILETKGYISVSQTHINGLLSNTKISLLDNPAEATEIKRNITVLSQDPVNNQPSENKDTGKIKENQGLEDISRNQSSENQDTENQSPENQDTENKDTNNNNLNINNLNINKINKSESKTEKSSEQKQEKEKNESALFTFDSPVGKISMPKDDARRLADSFENIEGLYELAICALSQRKTMPKSMFHFVWELGLTKRWKRKSQTSQNHNSSDKANHDASAKSEEDKLLDKWEQEDKAAFEKQVKEFMEQEGISDFDQAQELYSDLKEQEAKRKLQELLGK